MQITTENWQRTLSMQIWSLGAENVLVRLDSPPEEAGTATLKVGNNLWYYLPKAHRKMKAPPSMTATSWMGSHFTLDDLVKETSLTSDYFIQTSFTGMRDGVAVYEYTLTPKPKAVVVWGKIVLEIRQVDLMPVWQHYYDEDEKLVRELTFSEYKTMSERLIPTRLIMRPVAKPGEQTTIVYKDVAFDVPIREETFSLDNLNR
jgi:outer membrane lipoprotein-sorting protein